MTCWRSLSITPFGHYIRSILKITGGGSRDVGVRYVLPDWVQCGCDFFVNLADGSPFRQFSGRTPTNFISCVSENSVFYQIPPGFINCRSQADSSFQLSEWPFLHKHKHFGFVEVGIEMTLTVCWGWSHISVYTAWGECHVAVTGRVSLPKNRY